MKRRESGQGIAEYALILVLVIVVIIVILAMVGGLGHQAIHDGLLRDTVFSTEPRVNGTYSMWMTHDDVGVYCTLSQDIYNKARAAMVAGKQVLVHFESVNWNDSENGLFGLFGTGCSHETTSNTSATVYRITGIDTGDFPTPLPQ